MSRASATPALFWALLPLAGAWCALLQAPSPACEAGAARATPLARAACRGAVKALPGPARLLFGHGLDLATAPVEDWTLLPGIGPARAAAIVAERARGARFERPEDLERVQGIGPVTVERLRPWLGPSAPPLAAVADRDSPPPSLRRGAR